MDKGCCEGSDLWYIDGMENLATICSATLHVKHPKNCSTFEAMMTIIGICEDYEFRVTDYKNMDNFIIIETTGEFGDDSQSPDDCYTLLSEEISVMLGTKCFVDDIY
jgi:hypothetical protein